jgi:hypothetical protein
MPDTANIVVSIHDSARHLFPNTTKHRKRLGSLILALVAIMLLSGCAVKFAIVRERDFRSEETKESRIKLPLDGNSAKELLAFLKADGVRTNMQATMGDPYGDPVYGSLLHALSDSPNLGARTQKPGKFCQVAVQICVQDRSRHFQGKSAVLDVVDAREAKAVFPFPVAVSDGKFWWIFYHKNEKGTDQFQALLVTKIHTGKVANP